jgi:hypothetical protein
VIAGAEEGVVQARRAGGWGRVPREKLGTEMRNWGERNDIVGPSQVYLSNCWRRGLTRTKRWREADVARSGGSDGSSLRLISIFQQEPSRCDFLDDHAMRATFFLSFFLSFFLNFLDSIRRNLKPV